MFTTFLTAICIGLISASPITDNTLGVTECQDCLKDLYPVLGYRTELAEDFNCNKNVTDLYTCLDNCRPSDPLRILAYLRDIVLVRNQNKCYNRELDIERCEGVLLCLFGAMDEKKILCDNSEGQENSKQCFMNVMESGCSYADKLRYVMQAGIQEHCNGSGCIDFSSKTLQIYRTVPRSECRKFTLADDNGRVRDFTAPGGVIFDTSGELCGLNSESTGTCYN